MQKTGNTNKIQSSRMQGGGGLCRGGLGVNRGISFALTFDGGGIDTLRGGAVTAWCMLSHTEDEISFP